MSEIQQLDFGGTPFLPEAPAQRETVPILPYKKAADPLQHLLELAARPHQAITIRHIK